MSSNYNELSDISPDFIEEGKKLGQTRSNLKKKGGRYTKQEIEKIRDEDKIHQDSVRTT